MYTGTTRTVLGEFSELQYSLSPSYQGAVAERLRYRSREQKVPSSSPRSDISVEVTSQTKVIIYKNKQNWRYLPFWFLKI